MLLIHGVGVRTVNPAEIREHLPTVVYRLDRLLRNPSGLAGRFEHDGLPKGCPVTVEAEPHEVEIAPDVRTIGLDVIEEIYFQFVFVGSLFRLT